MHGVVMAVSRKATHGVGKVNELAISLVRGLGVEGDAHCGAENRHGSRSGPNFRQVHLIHAELHEELRGKGFEVGAGQMGENVTTRGIALLLLPTGTRLRLGAKAVIEVTGLRTPCGQLDGIRPGLKDATLDQDEAGNVVRKAGIMAIVREPGEVRPGDPIAVDLPPGPHRPLEPV